MEAQAWRKTEAAFPTFKVQEALDFLNAQQNSRVSQKVYVMI